MELLTILAVAIGGVVLQKKLELYEMALRLFEPKPSPQVVDPELSELLKAFLRSQLKQEGPK